MATSDKSDGVTKIWRSGLELLTLLQSSCHQSHVCAAHQRTIAVRLLRVNAAGGDAYMLATLAKSGFIAIAFDTAGILYGAMHSGQYIK